MGGRFRVALAVGLLAAACGGSAADGWVRVDCDAAAFAGYHQEYISRPEMSAITVGGPGLVAVGTDTGSTGSTAAAVWTSADGFAWQRVPHDQAVFDNAAMHGVVAAGPGLVAVGEYDGYAQAWASADGTAWERIPLDGAGSETSRFHHVAAVSVGGPGLVAVGSAWGPGPTAAAAWVSTNGLVWQRAPHDAAVFDGSEMRDVVAGGPGLVAVGVSGTPGESPAAVWVSVDGLMWERVPNDAGVFDDSSMHGVAAAGLGLVAVGEHDREAAVWTSADGLTWERVAVTEGPVGVTFSRVMLAVVTSESGLVAVGEEFSLADGDTDAAVWIAVDGLTWERVRHDEQVFGGPFYERMNAVVAGGPGLVAVGYANASWQSEQGAAVWVSRSTE